jgi:ureidoacrylate peracid hydrolase
MHRYVTPQSIKDRVLRRQGKLLSHETIDAGRTALVVVDMQNYFVAEGFAAEVPEAREIVPNINRIAKALRSAGGTVVWIQTTAVGALEHWGNHHKHMLTPDRVHKRLAQLDENHDGFKVYPKLDALPGDLRVKKVKYSAFIAGSSDIDAQLKARHRDASDCRHGDQRVLRVDRPRRDDARLPRRHAVRRQRLADRRGACRLAEQFSGVLR